MVWPTKKHWTKSQWSLITNPACHRLSNEHNKTHRDGSQDGTSVTAYPPQQQLWEVMANDLLPLLWCTCVSSNLTLPCSASHELSGHFQLMKINCLSASKSRSVCTYRCLDMHRVFYIFCMEIPHRTGYARPPKRQTNKQTNKKGGEEKKKKRPYYATSVTSGKIQNYFTENKTDLNCYQLRTPYDFELAAAFYTHCQELQITTQGSGEKQAFRLWKSYSWFTLVQAKTESTKQSYELCTEPSLYLPL